MKILASIYNTEDKQIYIIPTNMYDDSSWIEIFVTANKVEVKKHYTKMGIEANKWNIIHQNILEAFINKLIDPDFRSKLV